MHVSAARLAILAIVVLALTAAGPASADPAQGDCQNDTKLIGPILLSTADQPGTWWNLTREGFDAAGVTDYKGMIGGWFGTQFATLEDAVEALVDAVRPIDKNGNGFVCAGTPRGTKAVLRDPEYASYFFGVIDDKHVKD